MIAFSIGSLAALLGFVIVKEAEEFTVFATHCFLVQVPIRLAAVVVFRRLGVGGRKHLEVTYEPLRFATRESDHQP